EIVPGHGHGLPEDAGGGDGHDPEVAGGKVGPLVRAGQNGGGSGHAGGRGRRRGKAVPAVGGDQHLDRISGEKESPARLVLLIVLEPTPIQVAPWSRLRANRMVEPSSQAM